MGAHHRDVYTVQCNQLSHGGIRSSAIIYMIYITDTFDSRVALYSLFTNRAV